MFILIFVSRDFEVGRNVSCEDWRINRQSQMGLIYLLIVNLVAIIVVNFS